ncbi:MAG: hypothetical protein WC450_06860 [Candidatus Omnitrophota bacterium]|jgi:hypothetical protein
MMRLVIFILSICSFCIVLLMTQILSLFFHHEVFWFSLTIGAFLCIHGVGYGRGLRKKYQAREAVIMPGLFFSAVVSAAIPALYILNFINLYLSDRFGVLGGLFVFTLGLFGIVSVIGRLSGSLLAQLEFWGREADNSNDPLESYARFQFLGYFAATLLATLLPFAYRELFMLGLCLGLSVLAAMWFLILLVGNQTVNQKRHVMIASALLSFIVVVMIRYPLPGQYFLKKTYFVEPVRQLSDILRVKESWPDVVRHPVYGGYVDIVPFPPHPLDIWLLTSYSKKYLEDPAYPWGYFFFLNHQLIMNSQWDEFFQEYLVHVPVSIRGDVPRRVLVLGPPGPFILKDLVKYAGIENITLAGVDDSMIALLEGDPMMRYSIMAGALKDPRIRAVSQEAFSFLKDNKDQFDAVYIYYPDAVDFTTGQYYTREFFRLIADHMAPQGYAVLDSSVSFPPEKNGSLSRTSWPVLSNTLFAAGFKTVVPYSIDLEPDNPKAIETVGAVLFGREYLADPSCDPSVTSCMPNTDKLEQAQRTVASFSTSIKQGFVFMSKTDLIPKEKFLQNDIPIPLRVLNEQRFQRALGHVHGLSGETSDSGYIHSLLYPRLLRL